MSLKDKKLILGVCGSIAAYKAAILIRLLVKEGADVQVIMTKEAKEFISPLTLSTLSKNPVLSSYYNTDSGEWHNHVDLALSADLILIAPASANTLAKMANGLCDNLLTAVYLSARSPIVFAPAMDLDMWNHPSTRNNISTLLAHNNRLIPPNSGELASGLSGQGRMAEPDEILLYLQNHFSSNSPLRNKKVLVTAGPTYEAIDPVRFIGNHSSGKMGYAIAKKLRELGADVTLISGPTSIHPPEDVKLINITSAEEMYTCCKENFGDADITVMSAAVADYSPLEPATQKIKKTENKLSIPLMKTKDILAELGRKKGPNQLLIGFALETNDALSNATEKLYKKNLDYIILNSTQDQGAGFGYDTNRITILSKKGDKIDYPLKSKEKVAEDICEIIVAHITSK